MVLCLYFVMCYLWGFFFFFFLIVLLNTWIYYSVFSLKNYLIWWDKFSCTFKYIFINEIGFIKKIVPVIGQINKNIKFYVMGWGFVGPQRVGMGWEIFPRHARQDGNGVKQNHAGQRWRPHPSALPHPIAIPTLHPYCYNYRIKF